MAGKGDELIYVTYMGMEAHRIDCSNRFVRLWDHLMGSKRGRESGSGNEGLSELLRFTSALPHGRALTPISSSTRKGNSSMPVARFTHTRRITAFITAPDKKFLIWLRRR